MRGGAELAATVWDLAEGFAILAKISEPDTTHGRQLLEIASRLHARVQKLDRPALEQKLSAAVDKLSIPSSRPG